MNEHQSDGPAGFACGHLEAFAAARAFTRVFFLLSLLWLIPAAVHAQDFNYTVNGGSVTITGYTGPGGAVIIPATISGLPVTTIGSEAFRNRTSLTSVTIPNSVISIGSRALELCTSLTTMTFPNSITSIGNSAFERCTSLTEVTIPNSVTNLGDSAFAECTSLTSIVVDAGNLNFRSVDGVLFDKNQTTLITWPGGKTGSYIIPSGVISISDHAFAECSNLTGLNIPNSVASIGNLAFFNCTSLADVTIPDSVAIIGRQAFSRCTSLTSVTIPNSVTSIGDFAFGNCASLTNIIVDAAHPNYRSVDGVLFNMDQTTLIQCPGGRVGVYNIPNGVTSFGRYAFVSCISLTSVSIPTSVTSIGDSVFSSCTSLTNVTIPNSVASIGFGAFSQCTSLTSVTIPNSVISIGISAFSRCTSLTNMTIPNSVTTIGDGAFSSCASLTNITVDAANLNYSSLDGILFNKNRTKLIKCPGGKTGSYAIPASVTSFGDLAFASCTSLTSVTIPNSVASIISSAFVGCTSLASLTIPNSVTSIGNGAFSHCTSLTSVTIPSSVISIGELAFFYCTSLTSIIVDAANLNYRSVDGVLFNKSQTTLIQWPGGKAGAYTIPNSVSSILDYAFYNCTNLTSVTIPNSVVSIGHGVFYRCTSLTKATIPNSVISIGSSAFSFCSSLTSITIPNSVRSIMEYVFYGCNSLTGVYFEGDAPRLDGADVFGGGNNAIVYYLPGTTGWPSSFDGRPTMQWNPTIPTDHPSFGVQANQFGFTITGSNNLVIVVEAATSLSSPDWTPVSTNTLTGGSSPFSDPQWANHPARYYRLRSP